MVRNRLVGSRLSSFLFQLNPNIGIVMNLVKLILPAIFSLTSCEAEIPFDPMDSMDVGRAYVMALSKGDGSQRQHELASCPDILRKASPTRVDVAGLAKVKSIHWISQGGSGPGKSEALSHFAHREKNLFCNRTDKSADGENSVFHTLTFEALLEDGSRRRGELGLRPEGETLPAAGRVWSGRVRWKVVPQR